MELGWGGVGITIFNLSNCAWFLTDVITVC